MTTYYKEAFGIVCGSRPHGTDGRNACAASLKPDAVAAHTD